MKGFLRLFPVITGVLLIGLVVLPFLVIPVHHSHAQAPGSTTTLVPPPPPSPTPPQSIEKKIADIISNVLTIGNKLPEQGGPPLTLVQGLIGGICFGVGVALLAEPLQAVQGEIECVHRLTDIFNGKCSGVSKAFNCFLDFVNAHKDFIIEQVENAFGFH